MADIEAAEIVERESRLGAEEAVEEERVYVASQWQLMWWRFRRHKMAMVGSVIIILLYTIAIFCEFIAPHNPHKRDRRYPFAPPRMVHFVDAEGFHLRPFVYGLQRERDPETYELIYKIDKDKRYPIHFLVSGDSYKFWGRWQMDVHLLGTKGKGRVFFPLGTDKLGRDMMSRIIYGARISLSIGIVGVTLSFILGILLGGLSGYYGGIVDDLIQRVVEFLRCIPSIPLWMALSAALPRNWPPLRVYFGITVILSLIGWTGLARVVRGQFLSLREEDFVMAARIAGASELRIIIRHLVPSFLSYIIASLTLSLPRMILSETSLSFLGLGLRPPVISWGVLLQEAQNLHAVALAPWLLIPGAFVIVAVLSFNFMGDGLRDAADPYGR